MKILMTSLTIALLSLLLFTGFKTPKLKKKKNILIEQNNENYRLYCFNKKDLKESSREIMTSMNNFKKYFGVTPKKVTVVIYPSPEIFNKFKNHKFEQSDGGILFFMSSDFMIATIKKKMNNKKSILKANNKVYNAKGTLINGLGAIVSQKGKYVFIDEVVDVLLPKDLKRITKGCRIYSINDLGITNPNQLKQVMSRINEPYSLTYFNTQNEMKTIAIVAPPVKSNVVITSYNSNDNKVKTLTNNRKAANRILKDEIFSGFEDDNVLAHELGHLFVMQLTGEVELIKELLHHAIESDSSMQHSGSRVLPDYLDEIVANLCESNRNKKEHRKQIRISNIYDVSSTLFPLKKLFSMDNPMKSMKLNKKSKQSNYGFSSRTITMEPKEGVNMDSLAKVMLAQMKPKPAPTAIFYTQNLLLGEYLFEKGKAPLLTFFVNEYTKNPDAKIEDILQKQNKVPNELKLLEKDFFKWVLFKYSK